MINITSIVVDHIARTNNDTSFRCLSGLEPLPVMDEFMGQ